MNEQVKQRLVGAVVLVSLAVIFIPMLLDGGDNSSMPRYGSNVPKQPDFDFEPLEIPLQPVEPIPEDQPRVINRAEAPPPEMVKPEEVVATKETPPTPAKPASPTKPEAVPTAPQPDLTPGSETGSGDEPITWVVQVGSFSQSDNALSLRDKLRENGFTAYVEKYRDSGKTSYRVRVGPELKRTTAEENLKRLQSKLQLQGIIMGHP